MAVTQESPAAGGPVRQAAGGKRSSGSEAGYNMVVLMVAVTILMVLIAASLPMWSQVMKREREAELIFRGWQYAEAIRVFQQRHGRFPTRIEELMDVEPRAIRQLWEDPMTESGEWGLVFQGGAALPGQPGQGNQGAPAPRELADGRGLDDDRGGRDRRRPGGLRTPAPGERRTVGPIVGVRSLSHEESIRVLFGEQSYDAWLFTVDKLRQAIQAGQQVGFGGGHQPGPRPVRLQWLGKPFPAGLQPELGRGPGGQQPPDGGGPARSPGPSNAPDRSR